MLFCLIWLSSRDREYSLFPVLQVCMYVCTASIIPMLRFSISLSIVIHMYTDLLMDSKACEVHVLRLT